MKFVGLIKLVSRQIKPKKNQTELIRGPFLTSPLGANFDPQVRNCPPGVNLSPRGEVIALGCNSVFAPPLFWTIKSVHPWGWTSPLWYNFHPWGPSSSLGVKFTLGARGEVKNGPQPTRAERRRRRKRALSSTLTSYWWDHYAPKCLNGSDGLWNFFCCFREKSYLNGLP
jgi:hypothetical protein